LGFRVGLDPVAKRREIPRFSQAEHPAGCLVSVLTELPQLLIVFKALHLASYVRPSVACSFPRQCNTLLLPLNMISPVYTKRFQVNIVLLCCRYPSQCIVTRLRAGRPGFDSRQGLGFFSSLLPCLGRGNREFSWPEASG